MDYSAEGDLARHLRGADQPLSEEFIVSISAQLAEALSCMHKMSPPVLHMDVKPGNVLFFDQRSVAKLMDFDASQDCVMVSVARRTVRGGAPPPAAAPAAAAAETTMAYTAPEVASGERYGPPCDVFSLGVVMFCVAALPEFPLLQNMMFNDHHWADHRALRDAVCSSLRERSRLVVGDGGVELHGYSDRL
eukprot:gene28307-15543_t